MVYSKEEILTEAAFCYDVTKVLVASNMMYESYCDMFESASDEAFMEAGNGMIGTISNMITSFLKKVSETFQKMIKDFNDKMRIRKLKKSLTPELRERMIANTGNKIRVVDVDRVLKLADESEKFVNEFVNNMNKRIDGYISKAEAGRLSPKQMKQEEKDMLKYCQAATSVYNKLSEQIDDVKRSPRTVSVDQYFEIIEKCGDYSKALESADKSLQKGLNDMESTCRRLESIMKTKSGKKAAGSMLEAGEGDGTESPEEKPKSIVRRAIDTVKRVVGSVIKTVTNFTKVHSKLSILIGTALVAYNAEDAVKYVKNRKPLADNIKHFKADLKGGNPNDKVGKDFTVGETIIKKGVVTRQEALDLADGVRHAYNKEGNKKLLGTAVGATLLAGGAAGSYQKHNEKKAAKEIARRERAAKRYAEEGI